MESISGFELGWLVGILDGEGCFRLNPHRGYKYAKISVASTDKDILDKLLSIVNFGRINGPYQYPGNRKPKWEWTVEGENAVRLMQLVKPYMCLRRQEKIEETVHIHRVEREKAKSNQYSEESNLNRAKGTKEAWARRKANTLLLQDQM